MDAKGEKGAVITTSVDMLRVGECDKIYDAPCWCSEVKGSKPGHIHSSLPATHKEKK